METRLQALAPSFADLLLDTVFIVDAYGHIVYVNAACERTFGYSREEMIGRTMLDLVVPEDRARTIAEASLVMAGHARTGFENRYIRKDGSQVHIMWSARWLEANRLRIGVARDVSERRRAEATQAAIYAVSEAAHGAADLDALSQGIHRVIAELVGAAGFAIAIAEPHGAELRLAYRMGADGLPFAMPEQLVLRHCADAMRGGMAQPMQIGPEAPPDDDSWLIVPLSTGRSAIGALVLKSHPGMRYADAERELLRFVSAQVATAIERWRLHAELRRSALYDHLTGLPNRRLLYDRMKTALARCRRKDGQAAALFIDVDRLKQINDTHGHAVGDALLQRIAQRLQGCVREEDTVARLAGDEFVVLLEDLETPAHAQIVADKIRGAIAHPIDIGALSLCTQISVGIALYPEEGPDAEGLLKRADERMYREKKLRRGAA
jgi:diguanylate cyclase (GGDEF)-like protein/PAS domain S-box-containing protein